MASPTKPQFSNDAALKHKSEDRLHRADFAERIVEVLEGLPPASGLVIGIFGPWGDGKTTVLEFLRSDLAAADSIIVRDFNPWRLDDEDAILRRFFSVLADGIKESLSTPFEEATGGLAQMAKTIRKVSKLLSFLSKSAEAVDVVLAKLEQVASDGDSIALEELRIRLVERLESSTQRIVILVDDLDRLDNHETYTVLRLVKACANFPNVSFVLAMDDVEVARALGARFGQDGEASGRLFLEKIVQIPLKLPAALPEDLRQLFVDEINRSLEAAGIEISDQEAYKFIAAFDRGISPKLATPRAIKRFGNTLMFALPMLRGEVNTADLLLLEALRAFYPSVYDVIRDNNSAFSGVEDKLYDMLGKKPPRCAVLLEPLLGGIPETEVESLKDLLAGLFPRLSEPFGHGKYSISSLDGWSKERRVSSPDYCPRYFAYGVPNNDVPNMEVKVLLEELAKGELDEASQRAKKWMSEKTCRRMLQKLREVERTVDPDVAERLIHIIVSLAAGLPNPRALWGFAEPPAQAAILICRLLERLPEGARRVAVVSQVMRQAEPLRFGAMCLNWCRTTDKSEDEQENTLTSEESDQVRRVLAERIEDRSANDEPLFDPDVPQEGELLRQWRVAVGRAPVQAHLERVFAHDLAQVNRFLMSHAPMAYGNGPPRISELRMNNLENMDWLIDLDNLAEWVRRAHSSNFEDLQSFPYTTEPLERRLAEQFMFLYQSRNKDGKPPPEPA